MGTPCWCPCNIGTNIRRFDSLAPFYFAVALGDKDEAGNVKTNETENDKRRKRRKSKEDEKMKGEKWTKEDFPICKFKSCPSLPERFSVEWRK